MQDQSDDEEGEGTDDAEDDHNTTVLGGPVVGGALDESVVSGGEIEGRHFGGSLL